MTLGVLVAMSVASFLISVYYAAFVLGMVVLQN